MYNNFITSIEARIELYREVLWSDSSMETTNNLAAVNWRAHFMLKTFARTNWANTESHFSIAPLFRALQLNVECRSGNCQTQYTQPYSNARHSHFSGYSSEQYNF